MNSITQVLSASACLSVVVGALLVAQKHGTIENQRLGITNDNGHFYAVHPVLESTDIFYYGNVPMTNDGSHIYPVH